MKKQIFGVVLVLLLVSIAAVNLITDVRQKKADELAQQEFLKQAEPEEGEALYDKGLSAGNIPPDFTLETLEGESVTLSELKGKKVILNFWATWCPPCKAEIPYMQDYYEKHAEKDNVEIIAVNLTSGEKGTNVEKKVENFIEDYGMSFPVPLDREGEAGKEYQIYTIPTSFIIDSGGVIQKRHVGPMDKNMIKSFVREIN